MYAFTMVVNHFKGYYTFYYYTNLQYFLSIQMKYVMLQLFHCFAQCYMKIVLSQKQLTTPYEKNT